MLALLARISTEGKSREEMFWIGLTMLGILFFALYLRSKKWI